MTESQENLNEHVLKRELLFHGRYLDLERLHVMLSDGREGKREIVRVPDAAAVLPVDDKGNVHLVRQVRHAVGRTLIEVPAGLLNDGEKESDAAGRECEEETGFYPGELKKLLYYAHAEGYSTGFITLFLGTKLSYTGKTNMDETEFVEPVCLPYRDLVELMRKNQIIDSKTILCILLTREWFASHFPD